MKILILFISLALTNCAVNQQAPADKPLYANRADLQIRLGNTWFDGLGVTKPDPITPITFVSPVGIDRVQVTSCARISVCQSGGQCDGNFQINKTWLGSISNTFVYNYSPVSAEAEGCPLYIESFSKDNLTSWGFVAFRGAETLPAHSECNGEKMAFAGVTVCQSKALLEQGIKFDDKYGDVKAVAEQSCHLQKIAKNNFRVAPEKGFCRVTFGAMTDNGVIYHRAVYVAFDGVLIRTN